MKKGVILSFGLLMSALLLIFIFKSYREQRPISFEEACNISHDLSLRVYDLSSSCAIVISEELSPLGKIIELPLRTNSERILVKNNSSTQMVVSLYENNNSNVAKALNASYELMGNETMEFTNLTATSFYYIGVTGATDDLVEIVISD